MCGIFAYIGHKPLSILEVLKVLHDLEKEQELGEKSPVGGHGAGIAYLNPKGKLTLTRVAKTNTSLPVNKLQVELGKTADTNSSRLVLGHVRQASPRFQNTIRYKECTQPYQPNCTNNIGFTILTAHNGYLQNYQQLRSTLTQPHKYESLTHGWHTLIDSEVVAHIFEEYLIKTENPTETTHTLAEQIKGNNTIVILYHNKYEASIHAVQNGKTRGLIIWTSPKGEALICSREQPAEKILHSFLAENNYREVIKITHHDSVNSEAHFTLRLD